MRLGIKKTRIGKKEEKEIDWERRKETVKKREEEKEIRKLKRQFAQTGCPSFSPTL